jgi:thiol-disulfide isomerase/thioredoxin
MTSMMLGRKKNIFVALFLLLLYHAAIAKNSGGIEIHGKLKNFKERVVQIIFRWEADGKYYKDSCNVNQSNYVFKTKLTEPTRFSLQAKYISRTGKPFYKISDDEFEERIGFFLDPKKIYLTSIDSFTNTVCTGSTSNAVYLNYGKCGKTISEIDAEAGKIVHSLNLSETDSLNAIEKITDSLMLSNQVACFKKYATTVIGPFLLKRLYDQRYPVYKLKELYNLLSEQSKLTGSAQLLFKKLDIYIPLTIGRNFEWFTMADTTGKPIAIANASHKIILIDLWASWCVPCRKEMPQLKQIYNDFHDKGFEVVAVSLDEKLDSWKKAIIDDKLPWINVSDLKGWNSELIIKSYIQSIPFNILIDNNGKIIATNISMDDLVKKCRNLLSAL